MSKEWKVKSNNRGACYYYEDESGNKSELFSHVWKYSDGFGLVYKRNGKFAYRDMSGNLSKEEYIHALRYKNGFAVVQKDNGMWSVRDTDGNLHGSFTDVGYIRIGNVNKSYTDKEENEVSSETNIEYQENKIDEDEPSDEDFADDNYLDMLLKKIKSDTIQSIELVENKEQIQACKDCYNDTMEYVLSRAYYARQSKDQIEKQEEIERQRLEAEKQKALQELNLVD